jgi:hypothetical protein
MHSFSMRHMLILFAALVGDTACHAKANAAASVPEPVASQFTAN